MYAVQPQNLGASHLLCFYLACDGTCIVTAAFCKSCATFDCTNIFILNVEDEYVRAVKGGTGFTKCGGNYASSIAGQVKAEKMGCTQVLWLDGVHRKYVEEVGTMNIMFKIAGEIYTAPLEGTVLPGVTRDSLIHILRDWGYKVNETHLSVDDLMKAGHDGTLEEAFGTGTAAVVSPVGEFVYKDDSVVVNDFKIGELTQKLYDTLTGIQWGKLEDKYGWTTPVE